MSCPVNGPFVLLKFLSYCDQYQKYGTYDQHNEKVQQLNGGEPHQLTKDLLLLI
jgi:hypothetical protein